MPVDLAHAAVVDGHCHPWRNVELVTADPLGFEDRITLTGTALASAGLEGVIAEEHLRRLSESTPFVLAMRRRLAEHLGCEATREAVAASRREALASDPRAYSERLWESARVAALVYDDGYPHPPVTRAEFASDTGVPVYRLARIEPLIAGLRDQVSSYGQLEERLEQALEREAEDPWCVGFKTVLAYRTGLDVEDPPFEHCERSFERWRADGWAESRLHAKPVRDRLLRRTLAVARLHDRPVHIHCGGGDASILLNRSRPQDLFPLLREHADQPIVLVHSGWPWLEEGAYVSSVLPHVYLELSIVLPWASLAIDQKLELVLGVAPPAKLLYGSAAASEPEVIWLGAQLAREALARVLGSAVERRWLDEREAVAIGEGVLAGNTLGLHGIDLPG